DNNRIINVATNVLNLKIDAKGGDIVYLNLPKYPETLQTPQHGFILLDESPNRFYIIQTGLLNDLGPDSNTKGRSVYNFVNHNGIMSEDESVINIDLNYTTTTNVKITKRFIFERDSYVILIH